ncbi:NlpC/P60 family protein [Oenococcus sicerae]|uniref:C40 family peptidase n=1 Tax=Oenococcus sicerae TaxID=2203724 RepID=UPI0039E75286
MKKSSLKSKAFITALSALGVAGVGAAAAQADTYTIKNGDTLWRLAREHGTSVDALAIANKVSDPNLIIAGNTLLFSDTDQTAVASPAQQVAQSSSAASSSAASSASSSASSASSSSAVSASTDAQTTPYTVQAGDSLWLIAQQTGTNVDDLVKANGGKSLINVGQTIQIDQASASSTAVTSAAPVQTSSSAEETAASSASDQPTSASAASSTADTSSAAASSAYASSVAASQAAQSAANSVAASKAAASAAASSAYASSVAASQAAQSAATAKAKAAAASKPKAVVKTTAYTPAASSSTVQTVINLAVQLSKQNIPYVWGGSTTAGFDCSGLVSYVFQRAGISLPHYTVSQESYVSKHSVASAKPGDLLFWGNVGASYHVAIYIGNGQYVAAPEPGKNVEIETISSYFMPSFAGTVIH